MLENWKEIGKTDVPKGVPLIVTIKQNWVPKRKVLGPVYYLQSPETKEWNFYETFSEMGIIGPDSVQVIAWDFWPDGYME